MAPASGGDLGVIWEAARDLLGIFSLEIRLT
jgi:hypothetical protein